MNLEEEKRKKTNHTVSIVRKCWILIQMYCIKKENRNQSLNKIIQYINDKGANKSILYGAKDIYELKQKLEMYEDMKKETGYKKAEPSNSTKK